MGFTVCSEYSKAVSHSCELADPPNTPVGMVQRMPFGKQTSTPTRYLALLLNSVPGNPSVQNGKYHTHSCNCKCPVSLLPIVNTINLSLPAIKWKWTCPKLKSFFSHDYHYYLHYDSTKGHQSRTRCAKPWTNKEDQGNPCPRRLTIWDQAKMQQVYKKIKQKQVRR